MNHLCSKADNTGEALGRALIAVRTLPGRVCFLKTKGMIGLIIIESIALHKGFCEFRVREIDDLQTIDASIGWTGRRLVLTGAMPFEINALSLNLREPVEAIDPFTVRYTGGGSAILIHDPEAVAAVEQLRRTGTRQQLIHAINFGLATSEPFSRTAARPFGADGLVTAKQARIHFDDRDGPGLLRLEGLAPPAYPCLAWPLDRPLEAFIALCGAAPSLPAADLPEFTDNALMAHLIECDRQHRRANPGALPAVESTPELLYAHAPYFASLYHFEVRGACVNHGLSKQDLYRLSLNLSVFWGLADH